MRTNLGAKGDRQGKIIVLVAEDWYVVRVQMWGRHEEKEALEGKNRETTKYEREREMIEIKREK